MVVGLAGGLLTISALPFSSARMNSSRALLVLGLLAVHITACILYYLYSQSHPADSNIYYLDIYHFSDANFALGTVFTGKLTQFLRLNMGGSFLECFILFQGMGFWGLMLLMRTFEEIHLKMGVRAGQLPSWLLFLPSLHFWTVAIGKDAPLFFAVSLCVWAAMEWRRRIVPFLIAICVMVLFRAHVALISVMALATASALHGKISFGRKLGLLGAALVGGVVLARSVESTLRVNVTSATSISGFLQSRSAIAQDAGGAIGNAPFIVRLFSLLFRPLFFDASNVLGAIASLENFCSLLLFFYLAKNWRLIRHLCRSVFFVEFCATLAMILTLLLTLVYYNVGLGLRERVMILPPLLCVLVASWALPRKSQSTSMGRERAMPRVHLPGRIRFKGAQL